MPIISIAIQKGGCAKTTTTINLAAALKLQGHRVLLVDADPQASLTQALGAVGAERNLYTEISREIKGEDSDLGAAITQTASGLSLVASSGELSGAELELVSVYGREQVLGWMLEKVRNVYDYILIDCPPSVGMLVVNALVASDFVLLPLSAEYLPYRGVDGFMHHFHPIKKLNKNLQVLGLLLTRYDERKIINREIRERLDQQFGEKLFHTRIRSNIQLARAQSSGLDIFSYDPGSNGAEDYERFAKEFVKRIENEDVRIAPFEMAMAH